MAKQLIPIPKFCGKFSKKCNDTARWDDFNSKQLAHKKFLQNPFLGCLWSVWEGKIIKSAVEATIEKLF